jgi:hypothetical protein
MKDKIATFISKVEELERILEARGVRHWPAELRTAATTTHRNPRAGATKYLSFVGGMGSLTDVWICRVNGHNISDAEETAVNREVDQLQTDLFLLAKEIEKE